MIHLDDQLNPDIEARSFGHGPFGGQDETGSAPDVHPGLWLAHSRPKWNCACAAWRSGEFFKLLPIEAIHDFESKAKPYRCTDASILFTEGEQPDTVIFLLEGVVKLSMESIDGRRLTVGIAGPGEALDLAAVVSGLPYEMTAGTQVPCELTSLPRRDFLAFLMTYPLAVRNVGLYLSLKYTSACEQSHSPGVKLTSGIRLARLLLKWTACGVETEHGLRIECTLSNREIGECIGMARESVSRTLRDFAFRKLVAQFGSALIIPSVRALEIYANRNDD